MRRSHVLAFGLAAFLSCPAALAGDSEAGRRLGSGSSKLILCERLLARKHVEIREQELVRNFFGRPFVIFSVHEMKFAGKEKLGLPVDVNDRDLHNMVLLTAPANDGAVLRVQLGLFRGFKFVNMLEHDFPDPLLTGWAGIQLKPEQKDWSYEKLTQEFPLSGRSADPGLIGYHSEPDAEGVRQFVSFSDDDSDVSALVTFGIDVPCDHVPTYTDEMGEMVDEIRTPQGTLCRISVLSFARTD